MISSIFVAICVVSIPVNIWLLVKQIAAAKEAANLLDRANGTLQHAKKAWNEAYQMMREGSLENAVSSIDDQE